MKHIKYLITGAVVSLGIVAVGALACSNEPYTLLLLVLPGAYLIGAITYEQQ